VPATNANLVVSEFNYRPLSPAPAESAAGFIQRRDFEYLEILNIGTSAVTLDGVRFGAGLDYVFGPDSAIRVLAPSERALLVSNRGAFEMRYGSGRPVAGEFQLGSNLDDSGERLELLAADGSTIRDFSYNDRIPWPEAADGDGYSLVLVNPRSNPDHGVAQNWRPSAAVHGTPGSTDVLSYATWKAANGVIDDYADDDRDGVANVAEYLLMTNPASAFSRPVLRGAIQTISVDPGPGLPPVPGDYLTITFDRDPRAGECTCVPVVSADLQTWAGGLPNIVRVRVAPNPDGTQTEVWRSTVPVTGDRRQFAGLRVTVP
jgi:hypothetical protein